MEANISGLEAPIGKSWTSFENYMLSAFNIVEGKTAEKNNVEGKTGDELEEEVKVYEETNGLPV